MKHSYVAVPEIKKDDCLGCTCIRNHTMLWHLCPELREKGDFPALVPTNPSARQRVWKCPGVIWIKDTPKHKAAYVALRLMS